MKATRAGECSPLREEDHMGTIKRIFVTSDIHGHCTLLKDALGRAGYESENDDHLFVCCGDLSIEAGRTAQCTTLFVS